MVRIATLDHHQRATLGRAGRDAMPAGCEPTVLVMQYPTIRA